MWSRVSILVFLLSFTVAGQAKLISHWPFDLCSLSGDENELVDVESGIHGTGVGMLESEFSGRFCQSLRFDGKGSHVIIPHNKKFEVNNGAIAFWFKAPELSHSHRRSRGGMALFSKDSDGTDNGGDHLTIWVDSDGGLFVRHQSKNTNYDIDTSRAITVTEGQWHHLVYTFGSKGMHVYINGRLYGFNDTAKLRLKNNVEPIILGANAWLTDNSESLPSDLTDHFNGEIDDVRLYNKQLDIADVRTLYEQSDYACVSCHNVHHFQIQHDGAGLTCEAETVFIKACANADCSHVYDQDASVTLLPVQQDVVIPANSQGVSVAFRQSTPEIVSLAVGSSTPSAAYSYQCLRNDGVANCTLPFTDAGLKIVNATGAITLPTQVAGREFSTMSVQAVKDNEGVCQALLEGERSLQVQFQCAEPNQCKTPLNVNGVDINSGSHAFTPANFSQASAALNRISYQDAGRIGLKLSVVVDDVTLTSGWQQVNVIPYQLSLAKTSVNRGTRAGHTFDIVIEALSETGAVLPNYQPENLQMSVVRTDASPYSGLLDYGSGSLSSQTSQTFSAAPLVNFSQGAATLNARYMEVGSVAIDVRDVNYLGTHLTIPSAGATTLGTFIPAYFDVQRETLADIKVQHAHSQFSYFGQPIGFVEAPSYIVSAVNATGQITKNYDAIFDWQLPSTFSDLSVTDNGYAAGLTIHQPARPETVKMTAGVRQFNLHDIQYLYNRTITPIAPHVAQLRLEVGPTLFSRVLEGQTVCFDTEGDGDCDGFVVASVVAESADSTLRWGRLVLENTSGSELENKIVPVNVQYYVDEGQGFVRNVDHTGLTPFSITPQQVSMKHMSSSSEDITDAVNIASSQFRFVKGSSLGHGGIFVNQAADTRLRKRGIVTIELRSDLLSWDDYLDFDWNGNESGKGNPSAQVTFGIYRGNDRIIYWREVFD
ncbi:LamG domain-containing protein [Aestuariibacter sp. AA17]|uniref:LamG domain-containing protein n=1 Tax=Fluctibacter corallii TaxID=2984329 RepID=A0ABT3AAR6_9ALTE|nr:LamG domain-containing protein [Aestuariibacter sp. AA17]MCV2885777.1 LamG domain-containing protein [Aestuariibacter sp. AA17]